MISTTTSAEFIHKSVLGEEAPEALVTDPDGLYVDAMIGIPKRWRLRRR